VADVVRVGACVNLIATNRVPISETVSASPTSTDGPWTTRRVLEWTVKYLKEHGSASPRLDAEVLLAHARGCPRIQLYTSYDEPLSDQVRARMRELVQRRAASEPVAYLVGHREFFSLDFEVTPDVLIPRPDTETLVLEALELLKSREQPRVLDIGTGSGCIAVAIAVNCPTAQVTAVDLSPAAVELARRNAARHGVADRVQAFQSDLFSGLPERARFDAIVSNPPYVRTDEIDGLDADVRLHEPHSALVAGPDGLDVIRRIVNDAARFLAEHGSLLLECGPEQAETIRTLVEAAGGFGPTTIHTDLGGLPRVVASRRAS
jgi:release factor glutamine methyltransferase